MHHPRDRIAHTTAFVTRVVEHWLEREIAQMLLHCVMSVASLVSIACGVNTVSSIAKGNVLFNDTLNTFYLRLYGVG